MHSTKSQFGAASLAAVLLLLATISVATARGGNSDGAHRCQMGGWAILQSTSGQSFADQSECVSYAAGGGQLFAPTIVVTTRTGYGFNTFLGSYYFTYDFSGAGFHQSSHLTLTWVYDDLPWSTYNSSYPAGFATGFSGTFINQGLWQQRCALLAGAVISGTITVTDFAGVSATGRFTGTCSS